MFQLYFQVTSFVQVSYIPLYSISLCSGSFPTPCLQLVKQHLNVFITYSFNIQKNKKSNTEKNNIPPPHKPQRSSLWFPSSLVKVQSDRETRLRVFSSSISCSWLSLPKGGTLFFYLKSRNAVSI